MSLRPGLLPALRCARAPRGTPTRAFHYLSQQPGTSTTTARAAFRAQAQPRVVTMARSAPRQTTSRVAIALGLGLGLGLAALSPSVRMDAANPSTAPLGTIEVQHSAPPPPPQSIVSVPQLTFGATCGICAGVFVKKGFKLVAFLLGGVFVLLQYLSSRRFVTVDWSAVSKSYDGAIATVDENGKIVYPTPQGVLNGLIDFLTANFQQRATFVAGFILGLRLG